MKKNIIITALAIFCAIQTRSQTLPPLNGGLDASGNQIPIRTSPTNPNPGFDQTLGFHTNTFNWTNIVQNGVGNADFKFYDNSYSNAGALPPFGIHDREFSNPYQWGTASGRDWLNSICYNGNSDFYSEDGWELIKRDFNYLSCSNNQIPAATANTTNQRIVPYFVLYNKYTSRLRIWTMTPATFTGSQAIAVHLSFVDGQHTSALLSPYSKGKMQTLMEHAQVTDAIRTTAGPAGPFQWFYADFEVMYDPCTPFFTSDLNIIFWTINIADIHLDGHLVANLSTPDQNHIERQDIVNGSSTSTIGVYGDQLSDNYNASFNSKLNNNNTAYHADYGIQVYKNYEGMVEEYKKLIDAQDYDNKKKEKLKLGMEIVGAAVGIAAGFISGGTTVVAGAVISQEAINIALAATGDERGEMVKAALEGGSKLFEFLSGTISPDNSTIAAPALIQGDMFMDGSITLSTPQYSYDFKIKNPGCSTSQVAPEVTGNVCQTCATNNALPPYPVYNEVLGTFALKEKPKVSLSYNCVEESDPVVDVYSNGGGTLTRTQITASRSKAFFKLKENLKYVFNPAAELDMNLTKIKAAFVVYNPGYTNLHNLEYARQLNNFVGNSPYGSSNNTTTKVSMSPYLNLECLNNFVVGMDVNEVFVRREVSTSDNPNIQVTTTGYLCDDLPTGTELNGNVFMILEINLVSKNLNRNGKPNNHIMFYTYAVDMVSSPSDLENDPSYIDIPVNLTLTSQTLSTSPIRAWENIYITGDIFSNIGNVEIQAGNEIEVDPGGTVSPDITLKPKMSFINCQNPYGPMSPTEIAAFCQSSDYIANTAQTPVYANNTSNKGPIQNFIIVPNPATENINLVFNTLDETQGSLFVYDITGHLMKTVFNNRPLVKGDHNIGTDISDLAVGEYIVRLITTEGVQTAKLVKIGQ